MTKRTDIHQTGNSNIGKRPITLKAGVEPIGVLVNSITSKMRDDAREIVASDVSSVENSAVAPRKNTTHTSVETTTVQQYEHDQSVERELEAAPIVVRVGDEDFTLVYDSGGKDDDCAAYHAGDVVLDGMRIPFGVETMNDGSFRASCCDDTLEAEGEGEGSDPESAVVAALRDLADCLEAWRDSIDADIAKVLRAVTR